LGIVLGLMGLNQGIAYLAGINTEVYTAVGRPDLSTKLVFIQILYSAPILIFVAPAGLEAFLATRAALSLGDAILHAAVTARLLKINPFYMVQDGKSVILSVAGMACVLVAIKLGLGWIGWNASGFLQLLMLLTAGASAFVGCMLLLDRALVLEFGNRFARQFCRY
jgi:hypothetical protein